MNECYTATYGMQMPLFVCPENTLAEYCINNNWNDHRVLKMYSVLFIQCSLLSPRTKHLVFLTCVYKFISTYLHRILWGSSFVGNKPDVWEDITWHAVGCDRLYFIIYQRYLASLLYLQLILSFVVYMVHTMAFPYIWICVI